MRQAVIFIHGLGGNSKKSWGKFPQLIADDNDLNKEFEVGFYSFPTCIGRVPLISKPYPSIQALANGLKTEIDHKYESFIKIMLVGHSLGTLVIRKFLIDSVAKKEFGKVGRILLYAPPNEGSSLANISNLVSWQHRQLQQLCKESDFLENLNDSWFDQKVAEHFDIRCVIAGVDRCVSIASAKSICRGLHTETIADKGHTGIIKPDDKDDVSFLIFKKFATKDTSPNIGQNLTIKLHRKIQQQKNNKKYIPDVFIEFDDVKERMRYSIDPFLFLRKIVYEINSIDYSRYNKILSALGEEQIEIKIDLSSLDEMEFSNIDSKCDKIIKHLELKKSMLPNLGSNSIKKKLSEEKYKYLLKNEMLTWRIGLILDGYIELLAVIGKRCIILTEKAGQGKTNIICDFAENFIIRKQFLGMIVNGNEFNNINRTSIEDVILKEIVGFRESTSFEQCIDEIGDFCNRSNCTFTIIIDGLNENSNIELFSLELYKFIEKFVEYDFVRLILTCRSEYFKERFGKLFEKPSFQNELLLIDNFMSSYRKNEMDQHLQERIIGAYFQYFKVKNQVFDNVRKKLSQDFLLLRIFCEVYGQRENQSTPNEQVYDIFKDDLFREYFEYKYKSLDCAKEKYTKTEYRNIFSKILEYMVANNQFINIPVENIPNINSDLLNTIIDEDIFFRKDLIIDEKSALSDKEVLNFTFDEFRDYLLVDHLINKGYDIETFLSELDRYNYFILEGVLKYLFFRSRRDLYQSQFDFLDGCDKLFIDNIFSTNDKFINESDTERIERLFLENINRSSHITSFLMYRFRTKHYKNLNIQLLISIIATLDNEQYLELVNPVFKTYKSAHPYRHRSEPYHFTYDIVELTKHLSIRLDGENFATTPSWHNVLELYLLLSGVASQEYGGVAYEVINFMKRYIDKYPEASKEILLKNRNIGIDQVQNNIWKLMAYCAEEHKNFSEEIFHKIFAEYVVLQDSVGVKKAIGDFLFIVYKNKSYTYSQEQESIFDKVSKEQNYSLRIFLESVNR